VPDENLTGTLDRRDWWRSAVIYQVYPRSFADSDGDGIGDLPGTTSRLGYLASLGVNAVWISPFFPSPQADAGYDVADYCDVDPLFGSLADFDTLVTEAHSRGLRVIIDLVPNHTSDAHPWFRRALAAGPGSPERGWYHFRDSDPSDPDRPPNDWPSEFGGPAWTRTPDGQWYLHLFDSRQPDLNWEYSGVRAAFLDVLRFWLDRGVDGFRVDVAHGLIKAPGLPDAGHSRAELATLPTSAAPFWDQDGVHEIYREWRRLLDSYPGERVMVAEAWVNPADRIARYVRADEHHQAFNFTFLDTAWTATELRERITASVAANEPVGAPTTWVLSNHDVIRPATRLALAAKERATQLGPPVTPPDPTVGQRRARAAILLMLALPGSAYLYQGEELGLPEVLDLEPGVRQDPTFARTGGARLGRDGCRVPLPWRREAPAFGFSPTGAAWLPQPGEFAALAVDQQVGVPGSTLELTRSLIAMRAEHRLGEGSLTIVDPRTVLGDAAHGDLVVVEVRSGSSVTHVLLNLGPAVVLPEGARVLIASEPVSGAQVSTDCAVWLEL